MEGVAIDYFNKLKSLNIPMEKFCSHLSEKMISIIALLQQIFVLLFNSFFRKGSHLHYQQKIGITRMVSQISISVHLILIYYHVLL